MEKKQKKNLVDPFSYIRTIAALTIFVFHTNVFSGMNGYVINGNNWFMKSAGHGAVWVFFFLSGYFNIRGFLGSKPGYSLDAQGIKKFYFRRFIKVLFPVWCFYLIALTISEPAFLQIYPETIWRLLTFTYSGEPGCTSIAATWYVSSLTWLYLLTPLIALICRKLDRAKGGARIMILSVIIALMGLVLRFFLLFSGADWTQGVFVPFYCNLDIFIGGAFAYLLARKIRSPFSGNSAYAVSFIIYTLLIIIHSRIYYLGDQDGVYLLIHEYIMPTVYILIMTMVCILAENSGYRYMRLKPVTVARNPLRLVDAFSRISFQFYLIHNMVLFHLSTVILAADGTEYSRKMLIWGFIISVPLSVLFMRATAINYPGRNMSEDQGKAACVEDVNTVLGDENESAS